MRPYHKINSIYKRDPATGYKTFLHGEWSQPEFGVLENITWEWTEKIDGTNCRIRVRDVGEDGPNFTIGGRTDNAQMHPELVTALNRVGETGWVAGLCGLTLYGEGYGPGIQKGGGDYRDDKGFILFDVQADSGMWLMRKDVEDIARQLDIPVAPVVIEDTLSNFIAEVRDAIRLDRDEDWLYSQIAKNTRRVEGWVGRPAVELLDRRGNRIVTKIKLSDFENEKAR